MKPTPMEVLEDWWHARGVTNTMLYEFMRALLKDQAQPVADLSMLTPYRPVLHGGAAYMKTDFDNGRWYFADDVIAAVATHPQPAPERKPTVEIELPSGDDRKVRVVWSELKDGRLHLCVVIDEPATADKAEAEPIDEFHKHELLDRLHVINTMFDEVIRDHPAASLMADDIDTVGTALGQLYQTAGILRCT